jgi:hypothetical protein
MNARTGRYVPLAGMLMAYSARRRLVLMKIRLKGKIVWLI